MVRVLCGILIFFSASLALAEYRVFRLKIVEDGKNPKDSPTILSTLDQYQYPEYYPVRAGRTVVYDKSWMCWGRHGIGVSLCSDPDLINLKSPQNPNLRTPASTP